MAANISSGNIGADVRNAIVWRKSWVTRLTETEETFYNIINSADPPYTLFYSTGVKTDNINYQAETADLSIPINVSANVSWFHAMNRALQAANAVLDGLNTTKMKNDWKLAKWPWEGVTGTNPFAMPKQYDFTIVFELVNEKGRAIGSQTVRVNPTFKITRSQKNDRITIVSTEDTSCTVNFNGVRADDISDNLTIRIASINGEPPQNARFTINAISPENIFLRTSVGVVLGFSKTLSTTDKKRYRDLIIPIEIWGNKVTAIGDNAFFNQQLRSVTIPNGVTSIGNKAFANNQLTRVTIPVSVNHVDSLAFTNNPHVTIYVPHYNIIIDNRNERTYRTIVIGNQTWMAENLNYKTGNSWCYDDNESNCNTYGRLYDWNTAMNVCPYGWHLPTNQDWSDLVNAVGGKKVAGDMLKAKNGWDSVRVVSNGKVTRRITVNYSDNYGFSALPAGERYQNGSEPLKYKFNDLHKYGYWWTATEGSFRVGKVGSVKGMYRWVINNTRVDAVFSNSKDNVGSSVRCIQD